MAASDAKRQSDKRQRRRVELKCADGDAFILVDGERVRVTRFLPEPLDAEGYPTLGEYGPEPITFSVADVTFVGAREGMAAHGPRGPHARCRVCRDDMLRAQRAQRRKSAKAVGKKQRRRRSRRQQVISWAA